MNDHNLKTLQVRLEYKFKNLSLLKEALTHSSYANENKKSGSVSNERLEFLGDSVLGMLAAAMIYNIVPEMPEGQMTRLRAELVCEKSLAAIAEKLELGGCLLLGHGEEKSGGRGRSSILADTVEAVLAAIYLDGGLKQAGCFVDKFLSSRAHPQDFENTDYKTSLQEVVQEKAGQTLSYHVTDESGPDHLKLFTVAVRLNDNIIGRGSGKSKKEAEQAAARDALNTIHNND